MSAKEMFKKLDMEREEVVGKISYHFKDDMEYPYGMYAYVDFDLLKREYHTNMVNCDEEISKLKRKISILETKIKKENRI